MGLTFRQVNPTEGVATSTSVASAFASNVAANSIMFMLCLAVTVSTTFSVTDSLGNTWTQIGTNQLDGTGTESNALFWAKNTGGAGANTVTMHSTTSAVLRTSQCEYTGQYAGSGNPIDNSAYEALASGGTASSVGPVNFTVTNESLVCLGRLGLGGSPGVTGADGTVRAAGLTSNTVLEDRAVAAAGNQTASWTQGTGNNGGVFFAVAVKSATSTFNISGNAGVAGATVSYSGTASGSVAADGGGNYTISGLADGPYTITPSLTGYTFSPTSASETVSGSNITGVNFTASGAYSVPDCRVTKPNSATSRTVNGTLLYDSQTSSNPAIPPTDSRTAGAPVDCRVSPNIPENSRTPGTYGPGE